jgi:hypothetical protein
LATGIGLQLQVMNCFLEEYSIVWPPAHETSTIACKLDWISGGYYKFTLAGLVGMNGCAKGSVFHYLHSEIKLIVI